MLWQKLYLTTKFNLAHKYFVLRGKATREEFYYFFSACFLAITIPLFIPVVGQALASFAFMGLILPLLACATRRMHDCAKSGKAILISALIYLLAFMTWPVSYLSRAILHQKHSPLLADDSFMHMLEQAPHYALYVIAIVTAYLAYQLTRPSLEGYNEEQHSVRLSRRDQAMLKQRAELEAKLRAEIKAEYEARDQQDKH